MVLSIFTHARLADMATTIPRPLGHLSRLATAPLPVTLSLLLLGFLAAPWSLEHKTHMALHGLCAQRPSHSYWVGDSRLPFDARMMGIYCGFLAVGLALAATGGYRRSRAVSPTWAIILATLVGAMAVDGFNSLLLDMRLRHPYEPSNALRVVTGAGTGLALAVALCHLSAITLWRTTDRARFVVANRREAVVLAVAPAPLLVLVTFAPGWLYGPISILLILAALAVLAMLALICIVLLRRLDYAFVTPGQLQPVMAQAIVVGVVAMASLSAGRMLVERVLGTTPLT